jgi:hypothetical protein
MPSKEAPADAPLQLQLYPAAPEAPRADAAPLGTAENGIEWAEQRGKG